MAVSFIETCLELQMIRATETEVLVSVLGKDLTLAAELVSELWSAGIKA
jgi:histidyl-tRNA synthetase